MVDGGGQGAGMKSIELALELERVRGELATTKRKLANVDQLRQEALMEAKLAADQQRLGEAHADALRQKMEEQELSYRRELAKAQSQFRQQQHEAHEQAARVVVIRLMAAANIA
jgi:hypothetical protein